MTTPNQPSTLETGSLSERTPTFEDGKLLAAKIRKEIMTSLGFDEAEVAMGVASRDPSATLQALGAIAAGGSPDNRRDLRKFLDSTGTDIDQAAVNLFIRRYRGC